MISNDKMISNDSSPEGVILVGLDPDSSSSGSEAERSLEELAELAQTAGAEVLFYVLQPRDFPHPATYVGAGKIQELRQLIEETGAKCVICDDELSPSQMQNLSRELNVKILDRTLLILDIFAARARSGEGKLQVELAQLKYTASHLSGMRDYLSRQGGGIGTRGPGEKKLESDRRVISRRITSLNREIRELENNRMLQRKKRSISQLPVGAIVGYTNAGKSTLLNRLTKANVLEEDKLFATLDPVTRLLQLPHGQEILLTDTVGFVRKLPHNLIDAFRSTLEEAKYSDFLIHMVDASDPQMEQQMEITYRTLNELGITGKPILTIFNKIDLLEAETDPEYTDRILNDPHAVMQLRTSLTADTNYSGILDAMESILRHDKEYVERVYSYSDAGKIQSIRKYGELITEKYTDNGIYIEAYIPRHLL